MNVVLWRVGDTYPVKMNMRVVLVGPDGSVWYQSDFITARVVHENFFLTSEVERTCPGTVDFSSALDTEDIFDM